MNVTIITDASFAVRSVTKAGGWAGHVACNRGKKYFSAPFHVTQPNNITCEMGAVVNTVWNGIKMGLIQSGDSLIVQLDCMPAIECFTKFDINSKASKRTFRRNPDHIEMVVKMRAKLFEITQKFSLTIEWRHVKGHSYASDPRFYVQKQCDARARRAMGWKANQEAIENGNREGSDAGSGSRCDEAGLSEVRVA